METKIKLCEAATLFVVVAMNGLWLLLVQHVKLDLANSAVDLYLIMGAIQSPISPYKGLKLTIWSNCKTITPHPAPHVFQTNQTVCKMFYNIHHIIISDKELKDKTENASQSGHDIHNFVKHL